MHALTITNRRFVFAFLPIFGRMSLKKLSLVITDYFSSVDDRWTWTTEDGRTFEDAELIGVEGSKVIIHHRFGVAEVNVADLSGESRQKLADTPAWQALGVMATPPQTLPFPHPTLDKGLRAA